MAVRTPHDDGNYEDDDGGDSISDYDRLKDYDHSLTDR